MDNIISFGKGIRRQPSIGEAGELSELVNLIPKNGELVNVSAMVKNGATIDEGYKLVATHHTYNLDVYLSAKEGMLSYQYKNEEGWVEKKLKFGSDIVSVATIGNIISVLCDKAIEYAVFEAGEYKYLGEQLPDLPLVFGLMGKTVESKKFTLNANVDDDEFVGSLYGHVLQFVSENTKNAFMAPFFVRYAYKLYDQSLVMHSAPILMIAATEDVAYTEMMYNASRDDWTCSIKGVVHDLCVKVQGKEAIDALTRYGDIIESVEIYVSEPIQMLSEDGYMTDSYNRGYNKLNSFCLSSFDGGDTFRYVKTSEGFLDENVTAVSVFRRNKEEVCEDIRSCSVFRHLKSIRLSELNTKMTMIKLEDGILSVLSGRKAMSDDFNTHNRLIAKNAFSYNGRLNLYDVSSEIFRGYPSCSVFPYYTDNETPVDMEIYVQIEQDGKVYIVRGDKYMIQRWNPALYLYYPNPNAVKATIVFSKEGKVQSSFEVQMSKHDFLYGAYAFDNFDSFTNATIVGDAPIPEGANEGVLVRNNNYIYTSAVNNPFYFPGTNVVQVGFGDIVGVSTSAKALSQGQFGQFPLYAFCTDGIWALEVSSDGTYSAKQPISRDVCNNADSITQIDGAVVFTTNQGLKLIQGSEVLLLSGQMDGHNVDEGDFFPEGFFGRYKEAVFDSLVVKESRDFRSILARCKIAYDYPNQLLRIFPHEGEKHYVYSLDSREFSSIVRGYGGPITTVVAGYPSSFVQIGTSVFAFDASVIDELTNGLLLTRPIDLGEPFAMKKLRDLRMHHTKFHKDTKCKVVVFVSNDNRHWFQLASLRQGSYKYYRFGVVTTMSDDDRLSGMAVRYDLNRTNKLR